MATGYIVGRHRDVGRETAQTHPLPGRQRLVQRCVKAVDRIIRPDKTELFAGDVFQKRVVGLQPLHTHPQGLTFAQPGKYRSLEGGLLLGQAPQVDQPPAAEHGGQTEQHVDAQDRWQPHDTQGKKATHEVYCRSTRPPTQRWAGSTVGAGPVPVRSQPA